MRHRIQYAELYHYLQTTPGALELVLAEIPGAIGLVEPQRIPPGVRTEQYFGNGPVSASQIIEQRLQQRRNEAAGGLSEEESTFYFFLFENLIGELITYNAIQYRSWEGASVQVIETR